MRRWSDSTTTAPAPPAATAPPPPRAQAEDRPPAGEEARGRGMAVGLAALLTAMVVLTLLAGIGLFEQIRMTGQMNGDDAAFYSYRLLSQTGNLTTEAERAAESGDTDEFVRRLQSLSTFLNPGTAQSAAGMAVLRRSPASAQELIALDTQLQQWRNQADSADRALQRQAAAAVAAQRLALFEQTDRIGAALQRMQTASSAPIKAAQAQGLREMQWILAGLVTGSLVLAIWLLVLTRHARHFNQRMAQANARLESAVAHRTRQLVWLANTDPLTGLKNRRAFMETAEAQILQCKRYPHPLAALLIDIDHFKSINDRYGHHVGDQAIRRVTDTITNTLRDSDIIGRFGGEEFAALMPHTDLAAARVAADRVRQSVASMKIGLLEGGPLTMTISIGVSLHEPGVSLDTLLMRADMALYRAKSLGRNRVEIYGRDREEIAQ